MNKREIFIEALQKEDRAERSDFLDAACGQDADLRKQVEELLAEHERDDSFFMDSPPPGVAATLDQPITEKPGTLIDRYKLLEQIGEGGFGVVYMADQSEPVKRRVALKIIKPGMDTRQVIARFEAERQALAMMDHPSIAKVLDAGTTDSGRPYFVMELVKGVPISNYCDEHHLTPRERLELFVPVCQAVQHAHQKGIIHRDIKPSNVLVCLYDGKPVPKVIDFGVAKAISQRLTEKTAFTQFGQIVGTLEYMSPEQAKLSQLDIDTRSDIYSLGVLLYELLTGETPFDRERLRSAAFDELLRIIREEEPPRPSLRLSTSDTLPSIAANRKIEPKKLSRLVRGELDWIVMKALEKDRTRRYETATGLSADVERYLTDKPVQACPPSAAYRFRKFARRNKTALSTAAVVAVALLLGIVGTTSQAIRATRERNRARDAMQLAQQESQRANAEAAIARAVNDFINDDLLAQADPNNEPDRDIKLRTVLDRAAARVEGRFQNQPLVEAAIRHTLGETYIHLGEHKKAEEQIQRAREIRQRHLGMDHADTLSSMNNLAVAMDDLGRYAEAEQIYRKVVEGRRRVLGAEHVNTLRSMMNLAVTIYNSRAQYAEAAKILHEVIEVQRRVVGPEHRDTLKSMNCLAEVIADQGHYDEAETLHRQVLEVGQRVLGPEHPGTLKSASNLASSIDNQGRHAEAEKLLREVLETEQRVLGREHPETLRTLSILAKTLSNQRRHDESERLEREILEIQRRVLNPDNPAIAYTMGNLANKLYLRGQFAEAEKRYREVLEVRRRTRGPEHPDSLADMSALGVAVMAQGRNADAEEILREVVAIQKRVLGLEHPYTLNAATHLAGTINAQGRHDEAAELYEDCLQAQRRVLGPKHPNTLTTMVFFAEVLRRQGKRDEAISVCREAIALDPKLTSAYQELGFALEKRGQLDEAEAVYRRATESQASHDWREDTDWTYDALARVLGAAGHEAVVETFSQLVDDDAAHHRAFYHRGLAYAALKRFPEATEDLRTAVELCRQLLAAHGNISRIRESLGRTLSALGNVLRKNSQPGEAESAYREGAEVWQKLGNEFPDSQTYRDALGDLFRQLSHVLSDKGECAETLTLLERALELAPDNSWSHYALAGFRLHAPDESFRDAAQAAKHAAKAVELDPGRARLHRRLAEARSRIEDWPGTAESLEKMLELGEPADIWVCFQLAIAHGHLGDKQKGAEWHAKGVALMEEQEPDNPSLHALREQTDQVLGLNTTETAEN